MASPIKRRRHSHSLLGPQPCVDQADSPPVLDLSGIPDSSEPGSGLPIGHTTCGEVSSSEITSDADILYVRGKAHMKDGQFTEAEAVFRECTRAYPDAQGPFKAQFQLALALKRQLRFNEAVRVFERIVPSQSTRKQKVKFLLHKGSVYTMLGEHDLARAAFMQAHSLHRTPESRGCLAWHYIHVGFIKQAFQTIGGCRVNSYQHPRLYTRLKYILALCLHQRGQTADAATCLFQVLQDDPSSYLYWVSCGILFAEAGQIREAFDYFSQARLQRPTAWEVWHNFAVLYEKQDFKEEAAAAFETTASLRIDGLSEEGLFQDFVHPKLDIADFLMGHDPVVQQACFSPEIGRTLHLPTFEKAVTTEGLNSVGQVVVKEFSKAQDDKTLPSSSLIGLPMPPMKMNRVVTVEFLVPLVRYLQEFVQSSASSARPQISLCSPDPNSP